MGQIRPSLKVGDQVSLKLGKGLGQQRLVLHSHYMIKSDNPVHLSTSVCLKQITKAVLKYGEGRRELGRAME